MDKNVSIVKVDKRHYRVIAQENWGLTKAQMKGNHVHHRIRRSDGGTNDPSNLYVCSPLYHDVVWHGGTGGFIELAAEGGKKAHEEKDGNGKSLHALNSLHKEKDANGKSLAGVKGATKTNEEKDANGKSVNAVKGATKTHEKKDANGKSVNAVKGGKEGGSKGGKKSAAQIWESTIDGFRGNAGNVAKHNRANGWDPNARIRVG
jgi:hypothetical protein